MRIKTIRLLLLTCVVVLSGSLKLFGQRYDDISKDRKRVFFLEDFSDTILPKFIYRGAFNSNYRPTTGSLRAGENEQLRAFKMISKTSTGLTDDGDWEYELLIKYAPSTSSSYNFNMWLGRGDIAEGNNHIYFLVKGQRSRYRLELPTSKKKPKRIGGKLDKVIRFGEFNKFTIRKINQQYQFFVNEKHIGSLAYAPLKTSGAIKLLFAKLNMEIKYIQVSKISTP